MLIHSQITDSIISASIEVHRHLGPGLLESAYEACLCRELQLRQIAFKKQLPLSARHKDVSLDCGYQLDILVEDKVIVE